MPVPKHTPQTRTPRPKQLGHSTNSYESFARFLQTIICPSHFIDAVHEPEQLSHMPSQRLCGN
jgi:hypothetical protein